MVHSLKRRIEKIEATCMGSDEDSEFMDSYELIEHPTGEQSMKALLIALKSTTLEELIKQAQELTDQPEKQE